MSEEDYRRTLRHERKRGKLGRGRVCTVCGETDIRTLQASRGDVHCLDCNLALSGRSRVERHHPAGRKNDSFTVEMRANEHAVFSDMQNDWPRETMRNPKRSPLLNLAASHRAAHDTLLRQAEIQLEYAGHLEALEEFCRLRIDEDWHEEFKEYRRRMGL